MPKEEKKVNKVISIKALSRLLLMRVLFGRKMFPLFLKAQKFRKISRGIKGNAEFSFVQQMLLIFKYVHLFLEKYKLR